MFYLWIFIIYLATIVHSQWIETNTENIYDYKNNPIIKPIDWIAGDPTSIIIDNNIHVWANSGISGIYHYIADVNQPWNLVYHDHTILFPGAVRPFVLVDDDIVYLFYEQYKPPFFSKSEINMIQTKTAIINQNNWTKKINILFTNSKVKKPKKNKKRPKSANSIEKKTQLDYSHNSSKIL